MDMAYSSIKWTEDAPKEPITHNPAIGRESEKIIKTNASILPRVDESVRTVLLRGTAYIEIVPLHGLSYYSRTAEIKTIRVTDGKSPSFFMKVVEGAAGKAMVKGEFHSMRIMNNLMGGFAVISFAWGTYVSNPNVFFYISEFLDMNGEKPEYEDIIPKLVEMHTCSVSPNGKFGFECPTPVGDVCISNKWTAGWEEQFANACKELLDREWKAQGPNKELAELKKVLFERLVPRLLRPLETGGREIKPRLIHRDLSEGNCARRKDTGEVVVFDAGCCSTHNEMELVPWRPIRNEIPKKHRDQYFKLFPSSAPEEDVDGRNLLYCFFNNALSSVLWDHVVGFRHIMTQDLGTLDKMFPESYEEWCAKRGEKPFPRK